MTDTARAAILARIRAARPTTPPPPVERSYRTAGSRGAGDVAAFADAAFADAVRDYGAQVRIVATAEVPATIADALASRNARRIVAADGCPSAWGGARGDHSVAELDQADAVLTACHTAIADTGTIILDHDAPDQGPRALTLVPDYHLVIVRHDQIVPGVPDAIAHLATVDTQTWISGPSATSDIELERVEGVHGPRTLDVIITADPL